MTANVPETCIVQVVLQYGVLCSISVVCTCRPGMKCFWNLSTNDQREYIEASPLTNHERVICGSHGDVKRVVG
jgi:hypothetical protein